MTSPAREDLLALLGSAIVSQGRNQWNVHLCSTWLQRLRRGERYHPAMIRDQQPALSLFVIGLVGLGVLGLMYRDFAYQWQPVPASVPGRETLAVLAALLMVGGGLALLFESTAAIASRIIFAFLVIWALLKVPALIAKPGIEAVWLGLGEITALLAGGWVVFARFSALQEQPFFRPITGDRGLRSAWILFAVSILPIGLSHLIYSDITAGLVPAWLPYRLGWAYLTGVGQIACGLGMLFFVLPRAAAMIETGMIAVFALLVWGPTSWFSAPLPGMPAGPRFAFTAFFITWVVGAASFLVAINIPASRVSARRRVAAG